LGDETVPTQDESDTGYLSYMLRMWLRRDSKGEQVWCASLQEPGTRNTENFGDIGAMFSFLNGRLGAELHAVAAQEEQEGEEAHHDE
jgi:hypothetical protein